MDKGGRALWLASVALVLSLAGNIVAVVVLVDHDKKIKAATTGATDAQAAVDELGESVVKVLGRFQGVIDSLVNAPPQSRTTGIQRPFRCASGDPVVWGLYEVLDCP